MINRPGVINNAPGRYFSFYTLFKHLCNRFVFVAFIGGAGKQ